MNNRYLIFIIIVVFFPFIINQPFLLHIAIIFCYYAILCESWNLVSGYLGQISFAQAALSGVAAYTTALFTRDTAMPPIFGMLIAVASTTALSYVIGVISMKVKGDYLCLTTIGLSESIRLIILINYEYTRGAMGLPVAPLFQTLSLTPYYFTAFTLLGFSLYLIHNIMHSPLGLNIRAVHEDEEAAAMMGVDVLRVKTITFAFSGCLAGIAGAFYAHYVQMLIPDMMRLGEMALILGMTVIGGMGTFLGPLIGAFFFEIASEYIRVSFGSYHIIILAVALLVTIKFAPGGLFALISRAHKIVKDFIQIR